MAELKTKKTTLSVEDFLNAEPDATKRQDAFTIAGLMEKATKAKPKMWGPAIVGFGDTRLKYDSGRELDWFIMGFSPRKQALTLYVSGAVAQNPELLKKLGKYKTGKGCLYIKKLEDVDMKVLKALIQQGVPKK